jgi:signal peptidase
MSTTMRGPARRHTWRRVSGVVLVGLLVAGWWAFLRPSFLGGPLTLVTVTGTSMQPTFHTGDLAVMRRTGDYAPRDVVAFRAEAVPGRPGAYVIHRIRGGDATSGFVLRGDHNDWDDPWHPNAEDIAGELWFAVPAAGTALRWLGQPVHLGAVLAALAATMTMLRRPEEEGPAEQAAQNVDASAVRHRTVAA